MLLPDLELLNAVGFPHRAAARALGELEMTFKMLPEAAKRNGTKVRWLAIASGTAVSSSQCMLNVEHRGSVCCGSCTERCALRA